MGYYWAVNNGMMEILSFMATYMDIKSIMLREVSQTEKDRYCMILLICGIQEKTKTKPRTHRNGEQIGGCQGQRG